MSEFKGLFFDIPKELYNWFEQRSNKQKLKISDYLNVIADALEQVKEKLEKKQLPVEEGNFLSEIIKHANAFAGPLKDKHIELAAVFNYTLKDIMDEIQIADYYLDGKPRWDASLSQNRKNIIINKTQDSQLATACEEIKRAKGIIKADAFKFKIEGS